MHACRFWMESFMTVRTFLPFSSLSTFGSRGIGEGFWVPSLLQMGMSFPFVFIFRFLILMASIFHSKCIHLWAFDFSHVDELGFLLCQGFDKFLKRRHFQVAPEVNMTVWNVDTNTENSRPILERMVRNICFSSFDLSTMQALSCDSKYLNFVKKYWILSKIFGSNVRNSTSSMCPLISSCLPKIPSMVV